MFPCNHHENEKTGGLLIRITPKYVVSSLYARVLLLCLLAASVALFTACSPRSYIVSRAADAMSAEGGAFARDDDPELVREATPFALKTMESLLEQQPKHKGLLLALTKGFTQYSAAFVLQDALEAEDLTVREEKMERARRLFIRAKEYGLRGLSVDNEGFASKLFENPEKAAGLVGLADLPLLYWTAAAWSLAVSNSPNDPSMLADLPRCEALMRRALALDETFDYGAIHEFFIAFEGGRPASMGGSIERAKQHFERAMELSGGKKLSPLVMYAGTVSVKTQEKEEFMELLDRVLSFDAYNEAPQFRMANLVAQRQARRLKGKADDLFLE